MNIRSSLGNALLAVNVFIVVILIFEDKLVVPIWLQPLGRMHPLFLHFPIVLIFIALAMEILEPALRNLADRAMVRRLATVTWLAGAVSASITVLMGLLLATEEGYEGDNLLWHKWAGVSLAFLANFFYLWSSSSKYRPWLGRVFAVASFMCLLVTGHFGSALTHGDDFLMAPLAQLRKNEPVKIENAMVFNDVIRPVFEAKCGSCHTEGKLKGQLSLDDSVGILKGGKSGKLLVAGNAKASLLFKRTHLPLDDKKHMPPKGKAQLRVEEISLLAAWIAAKAPFTQKIISLPATDSLRLLAQAMLGAPQKAPQETYSFVAASEGTIKGLNNNYRNVTSLADGSPALAVNLFGQKEYSAEKIKELDPVKSQVVFLNLKNLPVKDADLKEVGRFENLRKVELNETGITAKGLGQLASLKHLKTIAASGTAISYDELVPTLKKLSSLKSLAIWNTKVTEQEIAKLKKEFPKVAFEAGYRIEDSPPIKLNPPQVKNKTVVFNETEPLELFHPIKGVEIRYTIDGSEPDSAKSPVFADTTMLRKTVVVKARAFKNGWYGSDTATFNFFQCRFKPDSMVLMKPFNSVHQAKGTKSYFDRVLGKFNPNNPAWATDWTGFRNNDMMLLSEFKEPVEISSVGLRTMVEVPTGIFPPSTIEVWGGKDKDHLKLLGKSKPKVPAKGDPSVLTVFDCKFPKHNVRTLKIVAKPNGNLPNWHGMKGKKGLLLVDEIFLN